MNRVIQVQNCIRIERDLPLFGIGDPNKYFAPSYCYIISPFDTLYRGQGTPIHPLTRKFYPPLYVRYFVLSLSYQTALLSNFHKATVSDQLYRLYVEDTFDEIRSAKIVLPHLSTQNLLVTLDRLWP